MKSTTKVREKKNIKYKHLILFLSIVLLLCSLSTVSASNQTVDQSATATATIQNNISAAIANTVNGDTITINPGTYSGSANNTNLNINTNITIRGNGSPGAVVIDAQYLTRIFQIANNTNVTFINLTFINGNASTSDGGAIYNNYAGTTMTFINCSFINNSASNNGGGAIYTQGNTSILDSNFTNNSAIVGIGYGGAIYSAGGSINVSNSNFENNKALVQGGAILAIGYLNVSNSNFTNNHVLEGQGDYGGGGAIYLDSVIASVNGSNFINNSAANAGGAILNNEGGNLTVNNSNFTNNSVLTGAEFGGGAIFNQGNLSVNNSNFDKNKAGAGAGIFNNVFGIANVSSSNFTANVAIDVGGGIYNEEAEGTLPPGIMYVSNSNFIDNSATDGGGIFNGGNMTVTGNTMTGNTASDEGNAIFNVGYIGALNLTYINNDTVFVSRGQSVTLNATLTDDMGNNVSYQNINFYVNGVLVGSVQAVEGYASISYTVPSSGSVILPVNGTYDGSGDYPINMFIGILETDPFANSTIDIPSNVTLGQEINITGVLRNHEDEALAGVELNITIGTETFNVTTNSTGGWIQNFTTNTIGNFNVIVSWAGNSTYDPFTNSSTLIVNKFSPSLTVNVPSNVTVGQTVNINGTLLNHSGNPIANTTLNVTVGNQTFEVTTDDNGVWSLNYTTTVGGRVNVIANWLGNETYSNITTNAGFDVNKITTNLTINVPSSVVLGSSGMGQTVTFSSKLTDSAGNPISGATINFYLNRDFISSTAATGSYANSNFIGSAVTDSNGVATIDYTFNQVGRYTTTAEFNGNGSHAIATDSDVTVVSAPTDSRTKTNLQLETDENGVLATLTDVDGNPIANKKITITINGKTFSGITDTNGQVIINYPNANRYKVTAIFAGDDGLYPSNATVNPDNSSDNNGSGNQSNGKAGMKETGVPIAGVLLYLIASVCILVVRKKL